MRRRKKMDLDQKKKDKVSDLIHILNGRIENLNKMQTQKEEYDYLILGDGPTGTYSMNPQGSSVNSNTMVISGTGGGKTKSVVEVNLLHAFHQSMAVLLTKRRLLDQYAPLLKSRGYDVKVLNLVHPECSDVGYDPLLHLKDEADIIGLSKAVLSSSGCTSAKEPYWETSAADLLAAFIRLAQLLYGSKTRMSHVLELISRIDYPPASEDTDCDSIPVLRSLNPVDQFFALQRIDDNV